MEKNVYLNILVMSYFTEVGALGMGISHMVLEEIVELQCSKQTLTDLFPKSLLFYTK